MIFKVAWKCQDVIHILGYQFQYFIHPNHMFRYPGIKKILWIPQRWPFHTMKTVLNRHKYCVVTLGLYKNKVLRKLSLMINSVCFNKWGTI